MTDERMRRTGSDEWLWMPLIFGILFGVVLSSITGEWWWVAIGVALGAAVGAARAGKLRRDR
jgi:hypothetical protein